MNNGPSPREFWEWLRSLPANLGKVGADFYLLGFILIIISGICALMGDIVPLDVVWRILGVGIAVMSLGVGSISVGAAYKSSTAAKMEDCSEGGIEKRSKEGNPSSDIDVIKKNIREIKESVNRIEKQVSAINTKLDTPNARNKVSEGINLVLGIMFLSVGLIASSGQIAEVGIILSIICLFFLFWFLGKGLGGWIRIVDLIGGICFIIGLVLWVIWGEEATSGQLIALLVFLFMGGLLTFISGFVGLGVSQVWMRKICFKICMQNKGTPK